MRLFESSSCSIIFEHDLFGKPVNALAISNCDAPGGQSQRQINVKAALFIFIYHKRIIFDQYPCCGVAAIRGRGDLPCVNMDWLAREGAAGAVTLHSADHKNERRYIQSTAAISKRPPARLGRLPFEDVRKIPPACAFRHSASHLFNRRCRRTEGKGWLRSIFSHRGRSTSCRHKTYRMPRACYMSSCYDR